MIKFFRSLRRKLLSEGKTANYLKYAVGEIILVVIGILIALQINNDNEQRKLRKKELHYLENIRFDLQINIAEMDRYVESRNGCIAAANRIIGYFEGTPLTDVPAFNADAISIYNWKRFYPNDNTFQELLNSGNLGIISNDTIKTLLQNIESKNKVMKAEEDHFRFDSETLLYMPVYELMDLNPMVQNFTYRVTDGQMGENRELTQAFFADYFQDNMIKNGFVMTVLEFSTINEMFLEIKQMSEELIQIIDRELADA